MIDIRTLGAKDSAARCTLGVVAGSVEASVSDAADFVAGGLVTLIGAGTLCPSSAPVAPVVTVIGQPGLQAWRYCVVAIAEDMSCSAASPGVEVLVDALAPKVRVKLAPQQDAYQLLVYRSISQGPWKFIGARIAYSNQHRNGGGTPASLALEIVDTGQNITLPDWLPASPPSAPTHGLLRTRILEMSGGVATLEHQPGATATAAGVHDCSLAWRVVAEQPGAYYVPPGYWRTWSNVNVRVPTRIDGVRGASYLALADGYALRFVGPENGKRSQGATVQGLSVECIGRRRALPEGGQFVSNDGHHGAMVLVQDRVSLRDVWALRARGTGVALWGRDHDGTNCNKAVLFDVWSNSHLGHGLFLGGSDSNACCEISGDFTGNDLDGVHDSSFLGSTHLAPHASANGQSEAGGRPYFVDDATAPSAFLGAYAEIVHLSAGQRQIKLSAPSVWVGGVSGSGFDGSNGTRIDGTRTMTPITVERADGAALDVGEPNIGNLFLWFRGIGNYPQLDHRIDRSGGDVRLFFKSAAQRSAFLWRGSYPRAPGQFSYENGFTLGKGTGERRFCMSTATGAPPPGIYQAGDRVFDARGILDCWIATANFGVASHAAWVANAVHLVGDVIVRGDSAYVVWAITTQRTSGRTSATEPTWPASGDVTDGELVWRRWGSSTQAWREVQ